MKQLGYKSDDRCPQRRCDTDKDGMTVLKGNT